MKNFPFQKSYLSIYNCLQGFEIQWLNNSSDEFIKKKKLRQVIYWVILLVTWWKETDLV